MCITSAKVLIGPQLIQDVFSTVESRLLDALIVLEKEFGNLDEIRDYQKIIIQNEMED
jgi:hypothetical protein